jgi:hypothetical protein
MQVTGDASARQAISSADWWAAALTGPSPQNVGKNAGTADGVVV